MPSQPRPRGQRPSRGGRARRPAEAGRARSVEAGSPGARGRDRRPKDRYRRPLSRSRRLLLAAVGVLAYLAAAALTAVVLVDLPRWGVLGSASMGLLVALLVVVGRAALTALRGGEPFGDGPTAASRTTRTTRTPDGGEGAPGR